MDQGHKNRGNENNQYGLKEWLKSKCEEISNMKSLNESLIKEAYNLKQENVIIGNKENESSSE